jgi:hypothetical protein
MKTLTMTLSAITAVALLTGCGGGGGGSAALAEASSDRVVEAVPQEEAVDIVLQNGRFIDASVKGLGFVCQTSGRSGVTDTNGIFTCNTGEAIAFYIADNHIATVLTQEVVTPYTLFPNNQDAAINLAQLLQTLDRDANPDNGIDLDFDRLAQLEGSDLDFTDENFDDDVEALLREGLINEEAARQHLNNTLGLSGFEEEGDDAPIDEGVVEPDEESGSSSSAPFWEIPNWQDKIADALGSASVDIENIDWEFVASSSSESSSSSSSAANPWDLNLGGFVSQDIADKVEIPSLNISEGEIFLTLANVTSSSIEVNLGGSEAFYNRVCQDEFGSDSHILDKSHVDFLLRYGADKEQVIQNLNANVNIISKDGEVGYDAADGGTHWTHVIDPDFEGELVVCGRRGAIPLYPVACYIPRG